MQWRTSERGKGRPSLKKIKQVGKKNNKRHETNIRDKDGEPKTEAEEVMKRWDEYIEDICNKVPQT